MTDANLVGFCIIFIALNLMLVGCSHDILKVADLQKDQPWANAATQAEGHVVVKATEMDTVRWLEWELPGGSRIDSRSLTQSLEEWLRQSNQWNTLARQNPNTREVFAVEPTMVIVALKPTVVITGPGSTPYYPQPMATYDASGNVPIYMDHRAPESLHVELLNGFQYGTSVPWSPSPMWFSPELDVKWEPILFDQDGNGIIILPWGRLILERVDDKWRVTTGAGIRKKG